MDDILPKANEFVCVGDDDEYLYIAAVDLEEEIWTCIDKEGNIIMYNFDENLNSGIIHISDIEWPQID